MFKEIILAVLILTGMLVAVSEVRAQTEEKDFEVGVHFSAFRIPTYQLASTGPMIRDATTDPGFGLRLGYRLTSKVSLEAEGNFFPRDRDLEGGQKLQGLFGVKAGKRWESVGVFVKARPGFVRFSRGSYDGFCPLQIFPPPLGCGFRPVSKTNFASDLGGVIEWYPSRSTILRIDAGVTSIRFGDRKVAARDTSPGIAFPIGVVPRQAETVHNFQGSIGLGWRF